SARPGRPGRRVTQDRSELYLQTFRPRISHDVTCNLPYQLLDCRAIVCARFGSGYVRIGGEKFHPLDRCGRGNTHTHFPAHGPGSGDRELHVSGSSRRHALVPYRSHGIRRGSDLSHHYCNRIRPKLNEIVYRANRCNGRGVHSSLSAESNLFSLICATRRFPVRASLALNIERLLTKRSAESFAARSSPSTLPGCRSASSAERVVALRPSSMRNGQSKRSFRKRREKSGESWRV